MKGLELSEQYYLTYGEPMLRRAFPDVFPVLAVGLFGSGSECYGFDDSVSQDHDFEPGFCILLPGENVVDRRTEFQLERAYGKLPKEFQGYKRSLMRPVGGARHGVFRTEEYYLKAVGAADGILTVSQWLKTPDYCFAEAVNGKLFYDGMGEVSSIRDRLACYPEDIRKKKLAGALLLMAQSGQYNYERCIDHGEPAAAQLAAVEFVKHTMQAAFLLNGVFQPYYKWAFRAMRNLPRLNLSAEMEYLLTTDNSDEMRMTKKQIIEDAAAEVIGLLTEQNLTDAVCLDLEKHAYSVNDHIGDNDIRTMHILAGV